MFLSTNAYADKYAEQTITADSTTCIELNTKSIKYNQNLKGTVSAQGTFGGGTISWVQSYDAGATTFPIFDKTGVAVTSTASDSFNIDLGTMNYSQTEPRICAVMAGSTTPSVIFRITDNN